jgi:hypothetical protein
MRIVRGSIAVALIAATAAACSPYDYRYRAYNSGYYYRGAYYPSAYYYPSYYYGPALAVSVDPAK